MKVTIHYAKVLKVTNIKEKNIKVINISLGGNRKSNGEWTSNGFASVYWNCGKKTFDYYTKIDRGHNIMIPMGELKTSSYLDAYGNEKINIQIWTEYISHINWIPKDKPEKGGDEKIKKQINDILDEDEDKEIEDAFDGFGEETSNQEQQEEENNDEEQQELEWGDENE